MARALHLGRPKAGQPLKVQRPSSKTGASIFNKWLIRIYSALTINIFQIFIPHSEIRSKGLTMAQSGTFIASQNTAHAAPFSTLLERRSLILK
jgi:hypothetical protein